MAITIDDIFDVSSEEEDGQVTSVRREVRLSGLTSTSPDNYVEEIYSSSVPPQPGSAVVVRGQVLYLRERSVSVNDDSPLGGAVMTVTYRRSEGGTAETGETPTIEVRGSLRQIERSKDRDGNPFPVVYTWPPESKATYPNGQKKADTSERISGTLRVLEPAVALVGSVAKSTNTPGTIVKDYVGKVNAVAWQGEDPRHWLCTEAVATPINLTTSPELWNFDFTFELDSTGWDTQTTLVFIDPQTGQPPADIAEGNGLLTVTWYETKNFNQDF